MNHTQHEKINYVEFPSRDLAMSKQFFTEAFDWVFEDYGPEYAAFENAGLSGGFYLADASSITPNGAALIVLYSEDLEVTQQKVLKAGGKIVRGCFEFPGGRRFHFSDLTGNELAVWSDC